jgi:hypothetical protein
MRERIRALKLLEVPPETLLMPPPEEDARHRALLASLRLRLTQRSMQTAPDATNLAIAYDVHVRGVELKVSAVRRRHELSLSRTKAIEKLALQLGELAQAQPLESVVTAADVEALRALGNRSGLNVPAVRAAAFALLAERAAAPEEAGGALLLPSGLPSPLMLRAVNKLRAGEGAPPVEAESFGEAKQVEVARFAPRERPPPVSDGMLDELQRRLVKKRKLKAAQYLPAPPMIRAAVDCCRDDVAGLRWDELNLDEVLGWHFDAESVAKRTNHHSRVATIKLLRDEIRAFGKLE